MVLPYLSDILIASMPSAVSVFSAHPVSRDTLMARAMNIEVILFMFLSSFLSELLQYTGERKRCTLQLQRTSVSEDFEAVSLETDDAFFLHTAELP